MFSKLSYLKTFILFLSLFTSIQIHSKNEKVLDLVSEVVAKEVFNKMRIKFEPRSLKLVKTELRKQNVPQNFLSYFSCQLKSHSYDKVKSCLKNKTRKESFNIYTTSLSEAITNLYNKNIVIFLM